VARPDVGKIWKGFKHWPRKLKNIWLQNILFLGMCTFSALLVTRPVLSAFVLLLLVACATLIAFYFRYRSFCNYVCPVSGFLSLYSMASAVEVRPKDPHRCNSCKAKACRVGSEKGWGCPWAQTPGRLERNNYCGMCMECIKTCAGENMTLRARPFFQDTQIHGYDEAWKAFIMISVALVYSVTLLGPWGSVKAWANISAVGDWQGFLLYAGFIWLGSLAVIPAVWMLAAYVGTCWSGKARVTPTKLFVSYSYLLVPIGLCAWIAFSFPLIMVNFSHILATMSDPMGWGWNLFGTVQTTWKPLYPEYMFYIQIPVLLLGLIYALKCGYQLGWNLYEDRNAAVKSLVPVALLCSGITMAFLRLFVG
jgi:hypothetical protein